MTFIKLKEVYQYLVLAGKLLLKTLVYTRKWFFRIIIIGVILLLTFGPILHISTAILYGVFLTIMALLNHFEHPDSGGKRDGIIFSYMVTPSLIYMMYYFHLNPKVLIPTLIVSGILTWLTVKNNRHSFIENFCYAIKIGA